MKCERCKKRPKKSKHFNTKYCNICRKELIKRPVGKLTARQESEVRRLAGTMPIKKLAKKVGTSDSTLDRWAKANKVDINWLKYRPDTVRQVCEYYAKHGKVKTQKKFPKVKVRSIVERYMRSLDLPKRQERWTSNQLIEVARMAGLVSLEKQASNFARPGANLGAMRSVWNKRFGHGGININGLSKNVAKGYVLHSCPYYSTSFWYHRNGPRLIALWVDAEQHLKPDVPDHLREAIAALAKFQRWLHGENAKSNIEDILRRFS